MPAAPVQPPSLQERLAAAPELAVADAEARWVDPRDSSGALAARLRALGLARGDRVGVELGNGPGFVAALCACLAEGLVFVPLAPTLTPEEREARLGAVDASALVDPSGLQPRGIPGRGALADDAAVILFTSGTESGGRAIALGGAALCHVADTHHEALGYEHGASVLGYLPWSHSFGFTLELVMGLLYGARLRSVAPQGFPELVAVAAPGPLFTVPRMVDRLSDEALRSRTGGIVGGAPIRGPVRGRLRATRLRVGYGQTECAPGVTLGAAGEWDEDDFLGRPLGCEVRLAAGADEERELLVRGPNVALGGVEAGRLLPLVDAGGWRHTGDLATVAAGGGYRFAGRQDELFKLDNGRMVNPVPLERPYGGTVLLIPGRQGLQPLVRGELPAGFSLPLAHLPPARMPESFWAACTTPTGKISRTRAQHLFHAP